MPDIPFFDAAGFFAQKISEVEQILIGKKTEREILLMNQTSLEQTLATLGHLDVEHQQALQPEVASLKEVLQSTERSLSGLADEIAMLSAKLAALQIASERLKVGDSPA